MFRPRRVLSFCNQLRSGCETQFRAVVDSCVMALLRRLANCDRNWSLPRRLYGLLRRLICIVDQRCRKACSSHDVFEAEDVVSTECGQLQHRLGSLPEQKVQADIRKVVNAAADQSIILAIHLWREFENETDVLWLHCNEWTNQLYFIRAAVVLQKT